MALFALTAVALSACLLLAGYLYLPKLVTDRLPVTQIQRLGFADFTGRISRIGLFRMAAGPLVFGLAEHPALSIGSIEVDYTPGELRRKKIRLIRINDVVINSVLGPGGITFPGLDLSVLARDQKVDAPPSGGSSPLAAVALDKLELRSGMLNLTRGASTYRIPFEADLMPTEPGAAKLASHVRLFPRDQLIALFAEVDVEHQKARVSLDGPAMALERFADLIHLIPGLDATGKVAVQANAMVTLAPFRIFGAKVDLTWRSGRLSFASTVIEPGPDDEPAILSAVSENLETWQIKAGGVRLQKPASMAMTMLAATVNLGGRMRAVDGRADFSILPFAIEQPVAGALKESLSLPLRFEAARKASGDWTAGIHTTDPATKAEPEPLTVAVAGVRIHAGPPRFNLTAQGDGQAGSADWQLDLKTIRATADGTIVSLPSTETKGQLQFTFSPHGPLWVGEARIQVAAPTFEGHGLTGKLDALTLSTRLQQQAGSAPVVDARLRVSNGRLRHPDSGLHLEGVQLDLPLRSDQKAGGSQGTFSVDRIVHHQRSLGMIQGRITQTKNGFDLSAAHGSDLFPGMRAAFSGTVYTGASRMGEADFSFQIPSYHLPAENDLGRFFREAKGVILGGTVSAQAKGSLSRNGLEGTLDLGMADGELTMADKKITVEGIETTLRFPDLPRIRSGPAQQIRFVRAAMGGIVVDGGTFDLQLESEKTLLIEKGRLNWCGGLVDLQALRITTGKQDYQVGLYCQRLGLSRILEQLGSVNARGSGTVNGRIPIVYSNGNIRFDDGFLFSTPGETGQIQLSGTDLLTRGIPAGTPQFAQVALAQAALKDYTYTWVKLGLVSEGEDFIMRLQFDGKPANPLPFIYKREIGSFVRVEAGAQGSVFQGIGLDVNLRLPLNQLLQYKDIVNMIQ